MSRETKRWFLAHDRFNQWVMVEVSRRAEWHEWFHHGKLDEELPLYVRPIEGGPESISFQCPASLDA